MKKLEIVLCVTLVLGFTGMASAAAIGFEDDTVGSAPLLGIDLEGNVTVETGPGFTVAAPGDAIAATEGDNLLYLTTGPEETGAGESSYDRDENGLKENDVALVSIGFPAQEDSTISLDYDVLTSEIDGEIEDIFEIRLDGVTIVSGAIGDVSGTFPAVNGFSGNLITGPDTSTFVDGRLGWNNWSDIVTSSGIHTLEFYVGDKSDEGYDTALLVDNITISLPADISQEISGTVVTEDPQTAEDVPLPGALIIAVDTQETPFAQDVCDSPGAQFSLTLRQDATVELLVQGPAGSTSYVSTYYPFMEIADFEPEDLTDLDVYIMPKAMAQEIIAGLNELGQVDLAKGIIIGVVEAASDLTPMAGVKISFSDYQTGDPVDADIVYLDENGELDPTLKETSSQGMFFIYNIGIGGTGSTDLQMMAEKQGYNFPSWPQRCRVYPYQASPEKVTVVPFEGSESGGGDGGGGGGGGGGCFISTARAK